MNWSSALDEMEQRLADAERAIAGGPAPAWFALPTGIGPLPVELRERAEGILAATVALEGRVERARSTLVTGLAQARRNPGPTGAYVDRQA
jgi:hypothetical protein